METNLQVIAQPETTEYASYYGKYISLVAGNDILAVLREQADQTVSLLASSREEKGDYRYAPGKWSIKEVVGHLSDTERVFAYRALRISRNDRTPMEGFEQDDYVRAGPFSRCRMQDLLEEFAAVRRASFLLFRGLDADAWMRRGVANKTEVSVRAIAYIIAGHELHHRKILNEKCL